ncbi:MAG: 23S rRNA (adenine(2503)-C(2))-methyltransferase RlmN [Candidatus Magasanikbacteria bacterium]|nr:23S rRNA (adenine(2503)-C(2))-methyltransferase RlmN [Candidatus Magasanikbacteria bacterium]
MSSQSNEFKAILAAEPNYRQAQIEKAWFDVNINGYDEITTLPKDLREKLKHFPWLTVEVSTALKSKTDNTRKYLFKLHDGNLIEMVVMGRKNLKEDALEGGSDRYTICVSSQAGCPMKCVFCATGKAGFKRQLSAEEIIDQYRFAERLLAPEGARVANIVMMGQGEPLLNYDNVKRALQVLLKNTDLGETKITVSTAGVPAMMEKLLTDGEFPPVRWALSLHSAIEETRKQIMPSNKKGFLEWLVKWGTDYHRRFPSRTHFLGFEYIMLSGVNDDEKHLQALIRLCKKIPYFRVNLIPYNKTTDEAEPHQEEFLPSPPQGRGQGEGSFRTFDRTPLELIEHWHEALMAAGFTSTIRYSQGQDIAAACGQLRNKEK